MEKCIKELRYITDVLFLVNYLNPKTTKKPIITDPLYFIRMGLWPSVESELMKIWKIYSTKSI